MGRRKGGAAAPGGGGGRDPPPLSRGVGVRGRGAGCYGDTSSHPGRACSGFFLLRGGSSRAPFERDWGARQPVRRPGGPREPTVGPRPRPRFAPNRSPVHRSIDTGLVPDPTEAVHHVGATTAATSTQEIHPSAWHSRRVCAQAERNSPPTPTGLPRLHRTIHQGRHGESRRIVV
eukprot:scaffold1782_cov414-Prasinococcus_capsulatus_cf.AAC.25